jgi:predicted transcriptional regulator
MLQKVNEKQTDSDLHMKVLAGIDRIVPELEDKYRLTILYYSGDLSRGNIHIRAVIEDVIPSVAGRIEKILNSLVRLELAKIQKAFEVNKQPVYRIQSLPALLANVYGPGYVWESLRSVFHKESLRMERLRMFTARKLNELANKEDIYQMKQELIFYYSFSYFYNQYNNVILQKQKGVNTLGDWDEFKNLYSQGRLELSHIKSLEHLGFVSGLLLRQFSNSYYQKTGKEFVKNRVMKFGSKLTPEMVWKSGLMRCEELAQQWSMNLGANFRPVLAQTLLGFLEKEEQLISQKDTFMTAFWSGYLLYKSDKKNEGDITVNEINGKYGGGDNE